MHTFKHTLILSLVMVAVALGGEEPKKEDSSPARQQLKPDRLISDNAFLYLSTPDFKRSRAAFERSAFRGLLREDEVAQPLALTYATLRDSYVRGDGTRSESETRRRSDEVDLLMRLSPLLEGAVALAIEGDAASINNLTNGVLPRFLLVASLAPGEEGEKRHQEIEAILEKHRSSQGVDGKFKDTDDRIGNYDVVRIENSELNSMKAGRSLKIFSFTARANASSRTPSNASRKTAPVRSRATPATRASTIRSAGMTKATPPFTCRSTPARW